MKVKSSICQLPGTPQKEQIPINRILSHKDIFWFEVQSYGVLYLPTKEFFFEKKYPHGLPVQPSPGRGNDNNEQDYREALQLRKDAWIWTDARSPPRAAGGMAAS
jgi:hypothetical protein